MPLALFLVPFVGKKLPLLPTQLAHCTALSEQLAPTICGSTDGRLLERRARPRRGYRGPIVSLALFLVPFVCKKLPLLPTHLAHFTALSQQLAPTICRSTDGRLRERRARPCTGFTTAWRLCVCLARRQNAWLLALWRGCQKLCLQRVRVST